MQVPAERHGELHTFAVFNKRLRVTSSAKRRRAPGSTVLAQTPDGSFRDLMRNARELLLDHCDFAAVPEVRTLGRAGLPSAATSSPLKAERCYHDQVDALDALTKGSAALLW